MKKALTEFLRNTRDAAAHAVVVYFRPVTFVVRVCRGAVLRLFAPAPLDVNIWSPAWPSLSARVLNQYTAIKHESIRRKERALSLINSALVLFVVLFSQLFATGLADRWWAWISLVGPALIFALARRHMSHAEEISRIADSILLKAIAGDQSEGSGSGLESAAARPSDVTGGAGAAVMPVPEGD